MIRCHIPPVYAVTLSTSLFVAGAALRESHAEDVLLAKIESAMTSDRPDDDAYKRLLAQASPSQLSAWRNTGHISIAFGAAWTRVQRTLPDVDKGVDAEVDRAGVSKFMGFIEGRLHVEPPKFWEEALLGMRARVNTQPIFGWPKEKLYIANAVGYDCSMGISAKRSGDAITLASGLHRCLLPVADIRKAEETTRVESLSVLFDEKRCYVAMHSDRCEPYRLVAYDMKAGTREWITTVWGRGDKIVYMGKGFHFVTLVPSEAGMAAFGVADDAAYVELFSAKDGKCKGRFCTSY